MPRPHPTRPTPVEVVPVQVIDPRWMLKAIGLTILAAMVCGYLTLCLLFYQGQWQLVLHPSRSTQPLDHLAGLAATPIRFDAADTGIPRLSGALLAPTSAARFTAYTVLFLRGGDASLAQSSADANAIALLQALGLNVFAFDYRGFGSSDPIHPSFERMTEDSQAALRYLLGRGIPEAHIILYGTGLGASLASTLAQAHPTIPALILEAPAPPTLALVLADPRTRALPVRALFREDFPLTALQTLATPKLLISYPSPNTAGTPPAAFQAAATPRTTIEVPPADQQQRIPAIVRFLDRYLHASP